MNIQVGIVSHPSRKAMADKLLRMAEATAIAVDAEGVGCEENHLRVMRLMRSQDGVIVGEDGIARIVGELTDWFVILEDDAVPCADFIDHLEPALALSPSKVVSLYLGTGNTGGPVQQAIGEATRAADYYGFSWLTSDSLLGSVAVAFHRSIFSDMLSWVDRPGYPAEMPRRITEWAQEREVTISYLWPSLVDHADVKSIIAGGVEIMTPRKAHRVCAADEWPTWSTGVIDLGHIEGWSPS